MLWFLVDFENSIRHDETFVNTYFEIFVDFENTKKYNRSAIINRKEKNVNTRIKFIRETLQLTQDAFGKRIGSARNTIANYETGNRTPSNAVVTSICKEFNVNEKWLRYGEGEMFVEMSRDEELAEFFGKIQCSDDDSFPKQFMEVLKELDVDEWEVLAKMAVKLANKIKRD